MDAVCLKGNWDVVIARDPDNNPEGVLIFHTRKYKGFDMILMPPMTFYNGIHFFYRSNIKSHSKIAFENKITEKLFSLLPKYDLYYQQFSPDYKNWLALYWKGFKQSTRYTYRLNLKNNQEDLFSNLKGNVRRNIKKAQELCEVKSIDVLSFWSALKKSYSKRSQKNPFQKDLIFRLANNLNLIKACSIQVCVHKETNEILAGTIITYDQRVSYYVCGFFNPTGKETGALSYLLWDNINKASTEFFDFEGSMLKDVEFFFRAFGATLVPHFRIWKTNSPLLKLITKFKKLPFLQ